MRGPVRYGLVGSIELAAEALCASAQAGCRYEITAIHFVDAAGTPLDGYRDFFAEHAIDAVYLGLPGELCLEPVAAAIEAGVHVLCEEPLAASPAEWAALASIARARTVPPRLASSALSSPAWHAAATFARSGQLGELRSISAVVCTQRASHEALLLECVSYARRIFGVEPAEVLAATWSLCPSMLSVALRFPPERLALITCGFDRPSSWRWDLRGLDGELRLEGSPSGEGYDALVASLRGATFEQRFARREALHATLQRFAAGVLPAADAPRVADANAQLLAAVRHASTAERSVRLDDRSVAWGGGAAKALTGERGAGLAVSAQASARRELARARRDAAVSRAARLTRSRP